MIYLFGWSKVYFVFMEFLWYGGTSKNTKDPQNLVPSYKFSLILGPWSRTVVESWAPGMRKAKKPLFIIYWVPLCVVKLYIRLLKFYSLLYNFFYSSLNTEVEGVDQSRQSIRPYTFGARVVPNIDTISVEFDLRLVTEHKLRSIKLTVGIADINSLN